MAYKMKPGSRQVDSPGTFRKNTPFHKDSKYTDKDREAYEAYKKDFARDVATGRYGATDRQPLSQDLAHRIGYKSPAASKAVLASGSRVHGRDNIDETTGRSAVRTFGEGEAESVGLTKAHAADLAASSSAIQRKKKK